VGVLGIVNECHWPGLRVLATWEGDGATSCHSSLAGHFQVHEYNEFLIESTILAHRQRCYGAHTPLIFTSCWLGLDTVSQNVASQNVAD